MHVVFIEPAFPHNQSEFVRGLHAVGARVTAIGEAPARALPAAIRGWLHGYEQISTVASRQAVLEAVQKIQEREPVDRLEATVEAHVMVAAHVREACGIPGTSTKTAFLCRDKPAMKQVLREADVPCAASIGASSAEDVRAFVEEHGYPVILKPRDAAGAAGTYRANDADELEGVVAEIGVDRGMPTAVEEFIEGHEAFYDTLCIDGHVVHDFVSHYYPNVLEAMRARWISPQIVVTNRIDDASDYQEVKAMGKRVIEVLGIGTSATHMEWFYGPKGLKFSEIGCRPPGVSVWDLYGAGNDLDLYVEWAKAIVHGETDVRASRAYSTGMIALRPDGDGRITGYEGLELVQETFAEWVIDAHLPPPGSRTAPVSGGYMANAWVRMRHPDYDELRRMLDQVGETVKVGVGA
ncbi:MAG: ATP-grasp domain-containing protein [Planctomycetota bacterium]|nr:ATP-grasp domain-containing protein [Planctomycetota bacterium]